jgi:osmotically-inducible protein OsmY
MTFQLLVTDNAPSAAVSPWITTDESNVAAAVERSLRASGYRGLRNVQVCAIPCGVQLQGTVPTYHLKQLAQAAALRVPGVREIRNELDVISAR